MLSRYTNTLLTSTKPSSVPFEINHLAYSWSMLCGVTTRSYRLFQRSINSRINSSLLAICFSLCISQVSQADEIPLITVSATPVTVSEAGSSISIITKKELLLRNAATLQDILREIPGFSVSQQGSGGAVTQVRVRGAEANQVLVLIDGVEVNDLAQGSEFDFSNILTADIERIEIVRGPQSSLWGSDAMAGVIHIITRPDDIIAGTTYRASLEGGSFGTVSGGISVSHKSDAAMIRASINSLDSKGSNISRTGGEEDGFDNTTFNLTGDLRINPDIDLNYSLRHTDTTTQFDGTDFFTTGLPVDADNETHSTYWFGAAQLNHTINNRFNHSLKIARTDSRNTTDSGNPVNDVTKGVRDAVRYQFNALTDNHRVSLLIEHESEDYSQKGQASFFGDPNHRHKINTKSYAMEYRYDGEQINLSASVRRDENSDFDDADAWRLTANWQLPNESTILFASVGESIKNPTVTERFGFFTNFIGNPGLQPETSVSREIGLKQTFIDGRFNASLTWFDADLANEINGFVFDAASGGFTAQNVSGDSKRSGAELEIDFAATSQLKFLLAYTHLNATEEDAVGTSFTEIRRPENSGSLAMSYEWSRASMRISVSRTGSQQDNFFPPYPPYQESVRLHGFTLIGLSGNFALNSAITLTARLENLADEKYEQVYGFASPGIGGYLGIRMNF